MCGGWVVYILSVPGIVCRLGLLGLFIHLYLNMHLSFSPGLVPRSRVLWMWSCLPVAKLPTELLSRVGAPQQSPVDVVLPIL